MRGLVHLSDLCKQFATLSSCALVTARLPVRDSTNGDRRLRYFGYKGVGIGKAGGAQGQ
jgi:hypothetical protein